MNPEDLLSDVLHDRVERTAYPSTPLSTVAGRAGAIRARRRRTTALAAAAAVAVVVVPGAVWLARSPGGSATPTHEGSSGPTSAPTDNPTSLADLPLGAKPGIDYVVGDTYVGRIYFGRVTSAVLGRATAVAPVRGGLVAAVPRAHSAKLVQLIQVSSDGTSTSLGCGAGTFALSTDGTQSAYWVKDTCTGASGGRLFSGGLSAMSGAGPGFTATARGEILEPVGIIQQGIVVNALIAGRPHAQLVDYNGRVSPIARLSTAGGSDENNDVVSGQLASDTSTGAIVDATTGAVKLRVPGWILGQFSIDGKYVIGVQPVDGAVFGDRYAIFDATSGRELLSFAGQSAPVWDTNDTLLSIGRGTNTAAIVRMDLKGNRTLATPIAHSASYSAGYRLATRP